MSNKSMYSVSSSDRIFFTPFLQSDKLGSSTGLWTLESVGIFVVINISFLDSFLSGSKVFNAFAMDLVETGKQHYFFMIYTFFIRT